MSKHTVKVIHEIPKAPRGTTELNPLSWLGVVVPEERINYVFDPETLAFAYGEPTYAAIGSVITSTAQRQRRGLYSIRVTGLGAAGEGISYDVPQAMAANTPHTFSVDHYGSGQYRIVIGKQSDNSVLASNVFTGQPFWQRISITAFSTSGALVYVAVLTDENETAQYKDGFYVDGFQFERGAQATTFISGSLPGFEGEYPNPYGWTGSPHNSASFRLRSTRTGGRIVPLSEFGVKVTSISGLGLLGPEPNIQEFAFEHGGSYGNRQLPAREFTVSGTLMQSGGVVDIHGARQRMVAAFNPIFGRSRQPVRLVYQLFEGKEPQSEQFYLDAVYTGGLEMELANLYQEEVEIEFAAADPFIYSLGSTGDELNVPDGTVDATGPGIPTRDLTGGWRLTGPFQANATVADLETGADGYVYAIAGISGDRGFYRFDGFEWEKLLDIPGVPVKMAAAPDGKIYIVGTFDLVTPVATSDILCYDGATGTYSDLQNTVVGGTPAIGYGPLHAAVYHPSGRLIVGGSLTSIGNDNGTVNARNVAAYNFETESWEEMGIIDTEGLPDTGGAVLALAVSPFGNVFAGGRFSPIYGGMHNLAYFSYDRPDQWRQVDSPNWNNNYAQARVLALRFGPGGILYVGGRFNDTLTNGYTESYGDTDEGGEHHPITNIGYYPDVGGDLSNFIFSRMRAIQNGTTEGFMQGSIERLSHVYDIAVDCSGEVWIAGDFDGVYGQRIGNPNDPPLIPLFIPSASIARFGPEHGWKPTEIVFVPDGYQGGEPIFMTQSVEFGTRCTPTGFVGLPGQGVPGSTDVQPGDLGTPSDYGDTLFIGQVINNTKAPYVLFPHRTLVDAGCSEDVRPMIRIRGPGKLRSIRNRTVAGEILFQDYRLLDNETLTIDLSGRLPRIYSTNPNQNAYRALTNLAGLSRFYLAGGENRIDITFVPSVNGAESIAGWIEWTPRYLSVDVAGLRDCRR